MALELHVEKDLFEWELNMLEALSSLLVEVSLSQDVLDKIY